MKPPVKRQFRMEGNAEFLAVKHAHDFVPEVNDWRAFHRGLVKAWGSDEHAWKTLLQRRCCLGSDFQGLMGKSVAPCGVGFLIGCLWNIKTDAVSYTHLTLPTICSV